MKKKLLAITLAGMMALSFTGCGKSAPKNETKKENVKKDNTKKEKKEENKLSDMVGKPLTETMKKIDELGYTATYFADGVDFTDFIDSVKDDYLTGKVEENPSDKTVKITLQSASSAKSSEAEKQLSKKLDVGTAWTAAKKYGQKQYGDKFELNYLVGKIDESAEDENTWSLKAECKVDGNKMTCEAKVTGTNDNPEVTSFDVY